MVRDVLARCVPGDRCGTVALVTGLKHYLGPFEAYRQGATCPTPLPRGRGPAAVTRALDYAQEDEVCAAASATASPGACTARSTIIGYALGNAIWNMGQTLAVQAASAVELGPTLRLPGRGPSGTGFTDMTDAGILAEQMHWAATTPPRATRRSTSPTATCSAGGRYGHGSLPLGASSPASTVPGAGAAAMGDVGPVWTAPGRVGKRLREKDVNRVASSWHADGDLGR